jgi:hypothetical protein
MLALAVAPAVSSIRAAAAGWHEKFLCLFMFMHRCTQTMDTRGVIDWNRSRNTHRGAKWSQGAGKKNKIQRDIHNDDDDHDDDVSGSHFFPLPG